MKEPQGESGFDDPVQEYVDSIFGPDRIIEVRIQDQVMRFAVWAELEKRGCSVSQGPDAEMLTIICP